MPPATTSKAAPPVRAESAKRSRTNTRARLLDAGSTVFSELGFQATTVEDLCAAAGFTRGAFYSNFTSKDELFLALWDAQAERITGAVGASVDAVRDGTLDVDSAITSLSSLYDRGWFQLNTEFLLHALRHPAAADALTRHREALRAALGVFMDALLHTSGLALPVGVDLDAFTRMVIATHEGCQHQALVEPSAAGQLEQAMLHGLLATCVPATAGPD